MGNERLVETNAADSTVAQYILSTGIYGDLLSQRRSGASSFYHLDALGSTDRLTGADEAVTDSYTYYAFGQERASSGTTTNPYRYVGRLGYYRNGTDLLYLRARYYAPTVGRFISADPYPDERSRFAYVGNRAVGVTDASGLLRPRKPEDCATAVLQGKALPGKLTRKGWYCCAHIEHGEQPTWENVQYLGSCFYVQKKTEKPPWPKACREHECKTRFVLRCDYCNVIFPPPKGNYKRNPYSQPPHKDGCPQWRQECLAYAGLVFADCMAGRLQPGALDVVCAFLEVVPILAEICAGVKTAVLVGNAAACEKIAEKWKEGCEAWYKWCMECGQ